MGDTATHKSDDGGYYSVSSDSNPLGPATGSGRVLRGGLVVKIPPPLRCQAQAVAKLRGETVSDVVRLALRDYVQESLEDARDLREVMALERA